jgi:expansin
MANTWMMARLSLALVAWVSWSCSSADNPTTTSGSGGSTAAPTTDGTAYGENHSGQYNLGPVDFAETEWHNACAPDGGYVASLRDATGLQGEYLAGVSGTYAQNGGVCDACILIKTATSRQIVARVVTYGATNAPGDIDVSPSVYAALNTEEYPRSMTWQFAACPDTGTLRYEFQTGANVWWTSLWVRNPRVPLTKVEVKSTNHQNFIEMARGTDGTLTDASGFGDGAFTFRLTAMDGQALTDTLPGFSPGQILESTQQFQ